MGEGYSEGDYITRPTDPLHPISREECSGIYYRDGTAPPGFHHQFTPEEQEAHDNKSDAGRDTQIAALQATIAQLQAAKDADEKSTDAPETNAGSQGTTPEPEWHYEEPGP